MIPRLGSLRTLLVCFLPLLAGQAIAQQNQNPQPPTPPPPKPAKQNPFETVPVTPEEPKPEQAKPAPNPQVQTVSPDRPPEDIIEAIDFRGVRRVPQDTLRAMIFTKQGDPYNEESLHRDFMALWNTNRFDDIHMEREAGTRGWIIRFVLVERRIVRSIKYDGLKSLQQSEVLDRFKERKVGLSVESQYDPNKVQRARNVLLDYLAERGRQFATVDPQITQVPPSSLEITFKVDEGPKVKVHKIEFDGNTVFSQRVLVRSMSALKPIGIPH